MRVEERKMLVFEVAEVTDMIESLEAAKSLRHLSGDQRRQLQETCDDLIDARDRADNGKVFLHMSIVVSALRCGTMTQLWLSKMMSELS